TLQFLAAFVLLASQSLCQQLLCFPAVIFSLPHTNVPGNCAFRVFQKRLPLRRIANVRSHEVRKHVIDPFLARVLWAYLLGVAAWALLLEVGERGRVRLELTQPCQITLGCFWSDQPLGRGVFLRHGATVTTVPLEGVAQGKHIDGGRCAT